MTRRFRPHRRRTDAGLAANIRTAGNRRGHPDRRPRPPRRPRRPPRRGRRHRRLLAWQAALLVVGVVLMGFLVLTVFPIRSYLAQQSRISAEEAELAEVRTENAQRAERAAALQTPGEIERLARSQYGMVRPGEIAYAILPAPETALPLPGIWPFNPDP